jgi:integral membrane protein (TIGR01906 family)
MPAMDVITDRIASLAIGIATAMGILALAVALFLNPVWVGFEQGRAHAAAWTGFADADLRVVTDAILADLIVGPPDFDVALDGASVLNERERAHMRDVRGVFLAFFVAAVAAVFAALVIALRRREPSRTWRAIRGGALGLVTALAMAGVAALVAFDVLFELFHRLFFSGGTYTFDPGTERLVQLFPFQFWQETAMAVGVVAALVALLVAGVAHERSRRSERAAAVSSVAERPGPARSAGSPP